jgi:DNA/RNA-binding domain of Phe-tRNA-synthetase-like protein
MEARMMLGWCASEVRSEFPELQLVLARAQVAPLHSSSPDGIRERLRELSNRFNGPRAVSVRREPVPAAYRVFFRHIGLDPDVVRTPSEAAVLERMMKGGFIPANLLEDVRLIALMDTGVPVWAFDGDALDGPLGIRVSREGELLGRAPDAPVLSANRLVVADASSALAVLFGELAPGHEAKAGTSQLQLFAIQVAGVPSLHIEEAMWICLSALGAPE